jgi:hypothetical protein
MCSAVSQKSKTVFCEQELSEGPRRAQFSYVFAGSLMFFSHIEVNTYKPCMAYPSALVCLKKKKRQKQLSFHQNRRGTQ